VVAGPAGGPEGLLVFFVGSIVAVDANSSYESSSLVSPVAPRLPVFM
jgi:hypothetical protein